MATYYVDLSQVGTGDGTSGNPFNFTQFLAQTFVEGDTYKLRGQTSIGSVLISGVIAFNIEAWDLSTYGPWRINAGGGLAIITRNGSVENEISGGIIYAGNQVDVSAYTVSNMFIKNNNSDLYINDVELVRGCTIICTGIGTCYTSAGQLNDCVFQVTNQSSSGTFNGCLFTGPDWVGAITKNGCQFNWTPPTWPAWDADKLLFSKSVLYANEPNRPPARGAGGGGLLFTGYNTDLFGRRRNDIGAFYYDRRDKIYLNPADHVLVDGAFQLYDESEGVTSWSWKIGSTVVSTEQNPTIGSSLAAYAAEIIEIGGVNYLPVTLTTDIGEVTNNIKIEWLGGTLNELTWDGYVFVIVGDQGTILTTTNGYDLIKRPVPSGVELYKLTGVAYTSGCSGPEYVVVGTKTVSPGNYSLLILTSTDYDTWTIDSEVSFASSYDPAISQIKVFWNGTEYVINGSTLHVITGTPGSWSAPIVLPFVFASRPLKGFVHKDLNYYSITSHSDCASSALMVDIFDINFDLVTSHYVDDPVADNNERCPFFYDVSRDMWTVAYNDQLSDKFIISSSIDLTLWTKEVDIASTKYPNGGVGALTICLEYSYIVGGNLTDSGIAYYYSGSSWGEISSVNVSLNAIASNSPGGGVPGDLVVAVGYNGAVVVL